MVAAVSRSPLPRLLARSVGHQGADREKTDTDGDRNADPHEAGSKVRPGASTSPCSNSTQLRSLVGDTFGLYLVSRRFEGGRLRLLLDFAEQPNARTISTGELSLLLEGSTFTVHKRAKAAFPLDTRSSL